MKRDARILCAPEPDALPLSRRWFPMGYPVEVATNSADVLSMAAAVWDPYEKLSNSSPVRLRIEVVDSAEAPVPAPMCHLDHLVSIVQSPGDFAIADLNLGLGLVRIGPKIARNPPWFAYHFLEPLAYTLLGARHFAMVHSSCVALGNTAALLCGPSGSGKTCLAYACAKRGWSFMSGDATQVVRASSEPTVVGRPFSIRFRYSAKAVFSELRDQAASLRPNGKCDLELNPRRLGLSVSLKARAGLVVFLNRVPEIASAEIETVSSGDALHMLSAESIRLGDAAMRTRQLGTLSRLLGRPPLRLTYSDPFDAERVLRSAMPKLE